MVWVAAFFGLLALSVDATQVLRAANCDCQGSSCGTFSVSEKKCLNTAPFPSEKAGGYHVRCEDDLQYCASIVVFSDAKCKDFGAALSPVCGTCTPVKETFLKVDCKAEGIFTNVTMCADAQCKDCSAVSQVLNSQCSAVADNSVLVQSVDRCAAVHVSVYDKDDGLCSKKPTTETMVAQDTCSDRFAFSCSVQPNFPALKGPDVLMTTCSDPRCGGECQMSSQTAGKCAVGLGRSSTMVTCGGVGKCASIALFHDDSCNRFEATYRAVCGSCSFFKGSGPSAEWDFMKVSCADDNTVLEAVSCNEGCTICLPNATASSRKPFQCANRIGGMTGSAMNLGVSTCDLVEFKEFDSLNCENSTLRRHMNMSEEGCSFGRHLKCGKFETQTLTIDRCGPNQKKNGLLVIPDHATYASGQCADLGNMSRRVRCSKSRGMCANLASFRDNQCDSWSGMVSAVCGSCTSDSHGNHFKTECSESPVHGQLVKLSFNCSQGCKSCKSTDEVSAPLDTCSRVEREHQWKGIFLRSVLPCDYVTDEWFTDEGCIEKNFMFQHEIAQGVCAGPNGIATTVNCAAAPYGPSTPPPPKTTNVLEINFREKSTERSWMFCGNNASSRTVFQDGQCRLMTDVKFTTMSRRVTCGRSARCVHVVQFNGTSCSRSTAEGLGSLVCGTCNYIPNISGSGDFMRVNCHPLTDVVSIDKGCDSTCGSCTRPAASVLPPGNCSKLSSDDGDVLMINQGSFQCDTVDVAHFLGSDCTHLIDNYTRAAGFCSGGQQFFCGHYDAKTNSASPTMVRRDTCGMAADPAERGQFDTFPDQTCYTPEKKNVSYSAACSTSTHTCLRFALFKNAQCDGFVGEYNGVCGSCVRGPGDDGHLHIECNKSTMTANIRVGCDSTCKVCQYPLPIIAPIREDSCMALPSWEMRMKPLGLYQCDAVFTMQYPKGQCQGTPMISMRSQFDCNMGERFDCANAPLIAPKPVSHASLTVCHGNSFCGGENCTETTVPTDKCVKYKSPNGDAYGQVTCRKEPEQCYQMVAFHESECKWDNQTSRFVDGVCGSCQQHNSTLWTKTDCTLHSGNVTHTAFVDGKCSKKAGWTITDALLDKCTPADNHKFSVMLTNLRPCRVAEVKKFSNSDSKCNGEIIHSITVGTTECASVDDKLEESIRVQCGYEVPPPPVDPTPITSTCGCLKGADRDDPKKCASTGLTLGCEKVQDKWRKLECSDKTGYCSGIQLFSDPLCSKFKHWNGVACGQCGTVNGRAVKVECDEINQKLSIQQCDKSGTCNPSSCTKDTIAVPMDQCVKIGDKLYAQSDEIVACNLMRYSIYGKDGCEGTPTIEQVAPQGACAADTLRLTCPNAPSLPKIPANAAVLLKQCARGSACSADCSHSTVPSGHCVQTGGGGLKLTCGTTTRQCVGFAYYRSTDEKDHCVDKNFMTVFTAVCGSCALPPAMAEMGGVNSSNYVYVRCADGVSYVSSGCDSTCRNCQHVDVSVRPGFDCAHAGLFGTGNIYVKNYGTQQCRTLSQETFTTPDCQPASVIGKYQVAEGRCESDVEATCGNFKLQGVIATKCNINAAPVKFEADRCVSGTGHDAKGMKVSCLSAKESSMQCVNMAYFSGDSCEAKNWKGSISALCGHIMSIDRDDGTKMSLAVFCDSGSLEVMGIDCKPGQSYSECVGEADEKDKRKHPVLNCSKSFGGGMIFNHGLTPCDAVKVQLWKNSGTCESAPETVIYKAQGVCDDDWVYTCDAPPVPQSPSGHLSVMHTSCDDGSFCMENCKTRIVESGACVPILQGGFNASSALPSARATCLAGGMCATGMLFMGSSKCEFNTSREVLPISVECGACMMRRGHWMRAECGPADGSLSFFHCSENCEHCVYNATRHRGECHPSEHHQDGSDVSILHFGVMPCAGVRLELFSDLSCSADSIGARNVVPQGLCRFDDTFTCGKGFTPPSSGILGDATVSALFCTSPTNCSQLSFSEGTCQEHNAIGRFSVSCIPHQQMCFTATSWMNSDCTDFAMVQEDVCGACTLTKAGFSKIDCDVARQTLTQYFGCTPGCTHCSGPAQSFVPGECTPGFSGSLFSMGITPCAAVVVTKSSSDATCAAPPAFSVAVAQDVYNFGLISASCSNAPKLVAPEAPDALLTYCKPEIQKSHLLSCSGTHCDTMEQKVDACSAAPENVMGIKSTRVKSISNLPHQCAVVVVYNESVSKGCNSKPLTSHQVACNSCFQMKDGPFIKVTCEEKNGKIVRNGEIKLNMGTQSDCSKVSHSITLPFAKCMSGGQKFGGSMIAYGTAKCVPVEIEEFTDTGCNNWHRTRVVPNGQCDGGSSVILGKFVLPDGPQPNAKLQGGEEYFVVEYGKAIDIDEFVTPMRSRYDVRSSNDVALFAIDLEKGVIKFAFRGAITQQQTAQLRRDIDEHPRETAASFGAVRIFTATEHVHPAPAKKKKSHAGAIAAVFIVLTVVALAGVGGFLYWRRRKQQGTGFTMGATDEPIYTQFTEQSGKLN